jgi:hypothetical protein
MLQPLQHTLSASIAYDFELMKLSLSFYSADRKPKTRIQVLYSPLLFVIVTFFLWPAVYADGSICLDILQNQWSPIYDVAAILTSIQVQEISSSDYL